MATQACSAGAFVAVSVKASEVQTLFRSSKCQHLSPEENERGVYVFYQFIAPVAARRAAERAVALPVHIVWRNKPTVFMEGSNRVVVVGGGKAGKRSVIDGMPCVSASVCDPLCLSPLLPHWPALFAVERANNQVLLGTSDGADDAAAAPARRAEYTCVPGCACGRFLAEFSPSSWRTGSRGCARAGLYPTPATSTRCTIGLSPTSTTPQPCG